MDETSVIFTKRQNGKSFKVYAEDGHFMVALQAEAGTLRLDFTGAEIERLTEALEEARLGL